MSAAMRVLGVVGWSGSGKTTLITALLPLLVARGLRVSTVKHAHHGFEIDRPGKDSHRHREAGAAEVLIASARRWALLHELREEEEPPLDALLARMTPVDLVLVEGFKAFPHPKLEVHRPALGRAPLWTEDSHVAAVASDAALPACPVPVLPLDEPTQVCHWITQFVTDVRGEA
jgi:molybdopterin-guanine dinucleotide biosynthesis adapter protein